MKDNLDIRKQIKEKINTYKSEVIGVWVDECEAAESAFERFDKLNSIMQPMYDLILSYSNYYSVPKDYGTGIELTMIEVHMLQDLLNPEFQTVSAIAKKWKRTNSAVSQTMSKLEQKGLITRTQNENDRKVFFLNLTDLGKETLLYHSRYDNVDIVKTHKKLFTKFTPEEIAIFFSVCDFYNDILEHND